MKLKQWLYLILGLLISVFLGYWAITNLNPNFQIGEKIDELNGVAVYYNGEVGTVIGRNKTKDGYNLGLKYQCVEFVKRYYYEHLNHKMPNSYGHAKDFFNAAVKDGKKNKQRNLTQYRNNSKTKPQANDLLIFKGTTFNKYGHVAIISAVKRNKIEITQQNPGRFRPTRETFGLVRKNGKWRIENKRVLGWLRKE